MKNIAIIPARSGSKGVKDKNIRNLGGRPLLAYTIEAALASGCFDTVYVSTDSEIYADIARSLGATVPFLRSAELSSDSASSWEVVKQVLSEYHDLNQDFDTFMLLQPTSPLRTDKDIRAAYKLFKDKKATAIVSVCECEHSPLWCNVLPASLAMDEFISNNNRKRRQDLKKYYRINGAIYLADVAFFKKVGSVYSKTCYAYIMDSIRSIDIDTELDFIICEAILNLNDAVD
jgi:CMP-N,N'-diacetyllegionaminic acid synthase